MKPEQSQKNGWNNLREKNPNEQILKNYIWENIKEITLLGGMELYNKLANDIERSVIVEIADIEKRMMKK